MEPFILLVTKEYASLFLFNNFIATFLKGDTIGYESLEDVIGNGNKLVDPECETVQMARGLGICFGD